MSEKYLPPADQAKCFFLTSPFIEPACQITWLQRADGDGEWLLGRLRVCNTSDTEHKNSKQSSHKSPALETAAS